MKKEWRDFAPAGKSLEGWDTAEETGDRRNCRPDRATPGHGGCRACEQRQKEPKWSLLREPNSACGRKKHRPQARSHGKNSGHHGRLLGIPLPRSEREVLRPHSLPDTPGRSRGTGEANLNIHHTKAALNKSPVKSEPGPEPKEREDTP